MKLKICGMKYNTQEVAALQPDYLGFIFYEKSPRNFNGEIPQLPEGIKKVGVFVDADIAFAKANIEKYQLDIIQLHGNESPEYIQELKTACQSEFTEDSKSTLEIWKVFGIKDIFDFDRLIPYESLVDAFLFDTKGKAKGGNGYTFDWSVLKKYSTQTPFILSGGIGLEEIDNIKEILGTHLPILALDINSKFEDTPGQKNIESLKQFINGLDFNKVQDASAKAEDSSN
ncbi:phosphoribosylanthranilate isomerase [Dokdonia sp.]|uniref:phosphoribosylanthranilate isomerase n=1 Tax=Dokdonia sp. TaxID=2024995 RepID=UPI003266A9C3